MTWIDCIVDNDYQIFSEEPFQIRRKSNKKIIKESVSKTTGYIRCLLNQNEYRKHRLIALQFIPNPDNLPEVDHINKIRSDNRIENLRWVSRSTNLLNRSSYGNYIYNYVDKLSENSFEFTEYGNHRFENYWYDVDADKFYYYNGFQYRELTVCTHPTGALIIYIFDVNNVHCSIRINKFKKQYNLII